MKLATAFNYLADVVVDQVKQQAEQGQLQVIDGPDGRVTKATRGVDPRLLGEAGRGLIRFAEFAGLMDREPEVNQQVVSMVNLAPPSDGGTFAEKWGNAPSETVDVTAMSTEDSATPQIAGDSAIGHSVQSTDPCDVEHPAADAATAKDGDQ